MLTTSTTIMIICTVIILICTLRLIYAHKQLVRAYRDYTVETVRLHKTIITQQEDKPKEKKSKSRIITPI